MTSEPSTLFDALDLPRPRGAGDVDERGIPLWATADGDPDPASGPGRPTDADGRLHDPEELLKGLNPPAAGGRRPRGSAAAHRRGGRVGQDPGAHPPDRLPARRPARAARPGPRHHLHQQGGRRDEGAGRRPRRSPGQGDVGDDLPLGLRADPAPGGRPPGPEVDVLDLRRRRQPAPHDPGAARPRPRPEALPAARVLARREQPQERPRRRGVVCGAGRPRGQRLQPPRAEGQRGLHDVPAAAAPGQRHGLRRPHHVDRPPAAGVPRCGRALPAPVPAHPRRRVPGHQRRAVPAGQGAGRASPARRRPGPRGALRASCASSATPTSRSTPSAGRRSATSSSSSRTTPARGPSCWSRTTAPRRPSCGPPTR